MRKLPANKGENQKYFVFVRFIHGQNQFFFIFPSRKIIL